jgi:hypothetical protein
VGASDEPRGDNWAESSRIICDFFHRREIPPRLAVEMRGAEVWARAEAA